MSDFYFLFLIAIVAFMYASVGHGGASGYLALMVLFGISPMVMKSSALMLNIFVSGIAFIQYYRQGFFNRKILFPFILLSIPLSFIGAKIQIETHTYKIILAGCLFIATVRILGLYRENMNVKIDGVKFIPALIIGGIIGLISGMIGIGGGILLSPVLLLLNWADMKQTATTSAAFIFLNSVSGLAGTVVASQTFSPDIYIWAAAAIAGGIAGAFYGSSRFNHVMLRYVLSIVLIFACFKLIIS
ncbi:MAG TPA: TSUP family transporter [Bacteroidia bacterium]|nr:TSUP family transporter [Bacteroidia bacterium]